MNIIHTEENENKSFTISTDGGSYILKLFENGEFVKQIDFNEHTLRIVVRKGQEWLNEKV